MSEKNPLLDPIARSGEPTYASIVRNRSGIDSGEIDFGLRTSAVKELSDGDKQEIANTAFALYESIKTATGKTAVRDVAPGQLSTELRVFELGDEWFAGKDLDEVRELVRRDFSGIYDNSDLTEDDIEELTDEDMDTMTFTDDTPQGLTRSFRDELFRRIAKGDTFPQWFAMRE